MAPGRRDLLDRAEHVPGAYAAGQRDLAGPLDDRTVHDRVGVGQLDLDDVDAGGDHRLHRVDAAVDRREPGRHAADQHAAVLGPGLVEHDLQVAHDRAPPCSSKMPNHFAAVSTSLSPRPERLTRIVGCGAERAGPRQPERAGERVRALDRRDDALGLGRAARTRPSPRRRSPTRRSPGRSRSATRAPDRRRGSRGRPRSSATRSSDRRRPAAGSCGRPGTRRSVPSVIVAACRPVSTPSPAGSKP